jgi:hypothetical protein
MSMIHHVNHFTRHVNHFTRQFQPFSTFSPSISMVRHFNVRHFTLGIAFERTHWLLTVKQATDLLCAVENERNARRLSFRMLYRS